ncbi:NAD-dependent epimerase/dehydratase family protein [Brochothrix thermosphacta]|uniref:NAD-dependent epimerase/dehydratase family protein n=1 Tax=Brochothrix thermosphacta TaxID=2756 RepID=UPI000D7A8887|nr:NAD-dependent epimerase/dehydratase family protein [Brochothrix thermosphacta]WKK69132.1 NAD-dependent epimerase/dehydratase family protein [Brochothrix thermosphacta]SPN74919.1 putative UDP-glucose epimerase [Brochothrix thermosphacta]
MTESVHHKDGGIEKNEENRGNEMVEKILITGGAGFIGSHLVDLLATKGYDVYIVDNLSSGRMENVSTRENVFFIMGDIRNVDLMKSLIIKHQFDYVFNLAAVASVAESIDNPLETHKVNHEAVVHLLGLLREYNSNLKRFIFSSSAAVYGNCPELPKKETSDIRLLSPYAIDKYASEQYVLAYGRLYDLPMVAVRFFNVYGPRQNPASDYSGVLSIVKNCFEQNKQFTIYGDGTQTRDFVYVKDVIQALELVMLKNEMQHAVYNVGTGRSTSLNDIIAALSKSFEKELNITVKANRAGDIKDSLADISAITSHGYQPHYDINRGLSEYVKEELEICFK